MSQLYKIAMDVCEPDCENCKQLLKQIKELEERNRQLREELRIHCGNY